MVCILKFSKRLNSVNSVGGVMVLILSTLSDSVLYLYQVLSKYLIGFRVMNLNSRVDARVVAIYKGHNSVKTVDGVMVLNLSKGFRIIERMWFEY